MNLRGVNGICKQLKAHGLPETTPAALVSQGATPNHQTVTGDLSSLHNKLKWFESEEEHRS